ncbi:putative 2-methylcitrate dehydratase [Ascoidea rubescens DSM 1968]|uniref:2-methylcitrate dehydratase n=1 Tax=Ascoidea rubescens DSM 1968 TaxID=1344418 RepID=A0A1D2VD37_9ASCO|nr:2-methylcitrate dehydratase [Ascoidea rubescens DSM 1968]ODV59413.1 2-methylcitrate dehydratase [Ascoidea rubescens DSM 1968]
MFSSKYMIKSTVNNRFLQTTLKSKSFTTSAFLRSGAIMNDNIRPEADVVLKDISSYIHDYKIDSKLAYDTARLCFLDTLGCGLAALKYPNCANLIGPTVPGTVVPNGSRVPGTPYVLDPIRGAFSIGAIIRWLDFNDCWLAAEWGHPSDNLGGILAVADYLTRTYKATNGKEGKLFKVKDVLEGMIKAHEIQGCLALENSYNGVGLDHVLLVKVATTAVVSKMLGLTYEQTIDAVSHAFVDGQALRTYRHAPNTMSRKSWAAGDACYRAVNLAYHVKNGETGMPSALTAKTWGFYDVLFKGKPFEFQRPYGSYVMENVLFKISFPAEFHAQTAVEAALTLHNKLKSLGKTSDDIASVVIKTQDAGMRIIDKKGPLYNYADRDHCIQYMVAIPLIHGRLTADDYSDEIAANPKIDELRSKMECVENQQFTVDYHDPAKRFIGNALTITLKDGTVLDEVEVNYPIGHRKRREEGKPVLLAKFERHVKEHFKDDAKVKQILEKSYDADLDNTDIDEYVALYSTA